MHTYDVIIIGGSYAGLAAAMALGRSLRQVLVIDSGAPCNRQTPHSHNFLTQDGVAPATIAAIGKAQVAQYPTIQFKTGLAIRGEQTGDTFTIHTADGEHFQARKLLFASGVKDEMPDIKGFAECWGISVLHCPYCHGYEVKDKPTGILVNGEQASEFGRLIRHWTGNLTIFTNGPITIPADHVAQLQALRIAINDKPVKAIVAAQGHIQHLLFEDDSIQALQALYARPAYQQHCPIPEAMGCQLSETGHIVVNAFQATTVAGIFAAGDATTMFRSVSAAVGAGSLAGAMINKELMMATAV
ncbi:NAD(P)/FAD-dependent oxidoreductase [Chitinophaga sp. Ak27]|uniref:NAD(P)/FAD-dependent oxidoreductase n=1 Tax=Chitinophaga sp. Ak27 TaxID=2726116 RepID=UPI00145CBA92|nr:NAD(P)/FAD-dependent oxidoreductase [Chitinophaga sp. Ak27]NLU92170.1 NAD(P)/FAD-dependent oxidoreductase [Chitinophaga sp. Ak27]